MKKWLLTLMSGALAISVLAACGEVNEDFTEDQTDEIPIEESETTD
ncbi:MAG: hypothetical protein LPK26_01500 [Bacillaceae bacterium]|uniref:Lipoprotein n=1 Tax=Alkalihalobacterium chitinilyticum TaxID=2980103 RepID=A0ABT5VAH0_9BACI|nr:hypothetical protein [Alkalihalobacterium chitinilyticum]MDE5412466.1 hypothetical protein [Alkalihalobacterium chitinilyticum]MEB1805971.1 hypothetical protein [Bacillaceae bacterium]